MVDYKNGRFRTDYIAIRKVGQLEIIFWNKETIYILDHNREIRYIFHRWFAPRKSYDDWRRFRKECMRTKSTNVGWFFEWAAVCGIQFTTTTRPLDLQGKKTREVK